MRSKVLTVLLSFAMWHPAVDAGDRAVITTTDFSSGSLAIVDLTTFEATPTNLAIHSDAVVKTFGGQIYVINRFGQDNIIIIDPDDPGQVVLQYSVGNGTNPQDIAFVSESKAYVARLQVPTVLIVNPVTGDSLGTVDLSEFSDADGTPEAAHLALHDGLLFVTCQRLDQDGFFAPTEYSVVAVVDTATDELVDVDPDSAGTQGITLEATNPFSQVQVGGQLVMSNSGAFGVADGGIEVVDLDARATLGIQMGESELAGSIGALAMVTATRGYVVSTDLETFTNTVKAFDLETDALPVDLTGTSGGFIPQLGVLRGRLYVSDQGSFSDPGAAGLLAFDVLTNELVAGPVSTGLPPNAIGFLEGLAADFNGDDIVNFNDFLDFAAAFGRRVGDPNYEIKFDLDRDNEVGFGDFLLFAADFGKTAG